MPFRDFTSTETTNVTFVTQSRYAMKKSVYLVATFALLLAAAQGQRVAPLDSASLEAAREAKQQYVGALSPDATTTCTYPFTSGTGNTYMKYCVTKNGNIAQFASPLGEEFIATNPPIGEGYAFCNCGSTNKEYYDYAGFGDSGNWKAPTTVSSTAQTVVISRETSDGLFTLTQTITQNIANAFVRVTMALKNNSTTTRHVGLLLMRM